MTLLDIKNEVANQLGRDDGSTANSKRDRIINRARRKFYSERRWSFLRKTGTLTFTAQLASLPTDYNNKFEPIKIYKYLSTTKYEFRQVPYNDVASYAADQYVYGVDKTTGKVYINTTDSTLTIEYTYLPTDASLTGSDDAVAEPTQDIEPIVLLAIAMWWLASERSTGKHQMFLDEYKAAVAAGVYQDAGSEAPRDFYKGLRRAHIITGYQGKR